VGAKLTVVEAASTDPRYGKRPEARTLGELSLSSFVLVDKPDGPSSHQVAAWVRDMFKATRAGHAGTLDPNATGLLLVALGDATKALAVVEGADKRYVGHITFHRAVDPAAFRRAAAEFVGPVLQVPPKKSAVRRERRIRRIFALTVLEAGEREALVEVSCEAGTYIRTLAHDLGLILGAGANLRDLRRTGVGPFALTDAVTLSTLRDAFENAHALSRTDELRRLLHPVEDLLAHHRKVVVKDSAVDALCHGAPLLAPGLAAVEPSIVAGDEVAVLTLKGEAVAVARASMSGEKIAAASQGPVALTTRVLMKPGTYPRGWKHGPSRTPAGAPPPAEGIRAPPEAPHGQE
jgi:H/ACA ribonucleoprotein complex subunit 4